MSVAVIDHIDTDPEVCGGKPRIAGSRIRVQDIVVWIEDGQSADEIVAGYPHLTLADVYAALAFYHDNRVLIDRQLQESEAYIESMAGQRDPVA